MRDPLTYRHPRTTHGLWPCDAQEAVACHKYRTPIFKRLLLAFMAWGWIAVPAVLAVLVLSGCDNRETAVERAVFADAAAAAQDVEQQQRIERIAAMVEASQ